MKRISKSFARKLFAKGATFYMVPVNLRPEYGYKIDNNVGCEFEHDWDRLYNTYCYYNCDNERGRYPAYYVDA